MPEGHAADPGDAARGWPSSQSQRQQSMVSDGGSNDTEDTPGKAWRADKVQKGSSVLSTIQEEEEEEELDEAEEPPPTPAGTEDLGDSEATRLPAPELPFVSRARLQKFFHSWHFQVAIICLVILDALLVLNELIPSSFGERELTALHWANVTILTFFTGEILCKMLIFHLNFFHNKIEVLDAVLVFVLLVLNITFLSWRPMYKALGLLILLRLWWVAWVIKRIIIFQKDSKQYLSRPKKCHGQAPGP